MLWQPNSFWTGAGPQTQAAQAEQQSHRDGQTGLLPVNQVPHILYVEGPWPPINEPHPSGDLPFALKSWPITTDANPKRKWKDQLILKYGQKPGQKEGKKPRKTKIPGRVAPEPCLPSVQASLFHLVPAPLMVIRAPNKKLSGTVAQIHQKKVGKFVR